jgi:hypothetical protein
MFKVPDKFIPVMYVRYQRFIPLPDFIPVDFLLFEIRIIFIQIRPEFVKIFLIDCMGEDLVGKKH